MKYSTPAGFVQKEFGMPADNGPTRRVLILHTTTIKKKHFAI